MAVGPAGKVLGRGSGPTFLLDRHRAGRRGDERVLAHRAVVHVRSEGERVLDDPEWPVAGDLLGPRHAAVRGDGRERVVRDRVALIGAAVAVEMETSQPI